MKTFIQRTAGLFVFAFASALFVAPAPVQADDWGFSINVPFFRIHAHDGYYYRDNVYHNNYWYRGRLYEPERRYYYYPHRHRHHDPHRYDRWIGPHGHPYKDRHDAKPKDRHD